MRQRVLTLPAALALALAFTSPAWACLPPPPPPPPHGQEPGETADAFVARFAAYQAARAEEARLEAEATERNMLASESNLWTKSETVFVARVVKRSQVRLNDYYYGEAPQVRLRPLRLLKGRRLPGAFALTHTGATSCGPYGGGDAVAKGAVGEIFVVFVEKGAPNRRTVTDTIGPARARDPRTRAALTQATAAK